ncbi:TonB-dependent receptor [Phenylobacterium sp.]|uniref:TonB-dependent receptor n=1 Tax=Phenylobacterium sp. TaxID=1871053 RepID=UPI0035AF8298
MQTKLRLAVLLGSTALFLPHQVWAADAAADTSGLQVEEVVVTANKRKESLQDVPIAVTAITAETAAAVGVTDVSSLQQTVPGLQFPRLFSGSSPALRGIGTSFGIGGQENVVALYIDDVYLASPSATTFSFNNIEQIEVLKGPQGTLFGRNAMAGVINITTRTPGSEPQADLSLGYGAYQTYSGAFYGSYGFTDWLKADLAVTADRQVDGWGTNLFNGHDAFTERSLSARSKWVFTPDDLTTITLIADYTDTKYDEGIAMRPVRGALFPNGQVFEGFYNVDENVQSYVHTKQGGLSLKVDRDLGFADAISVSALRRSQAFNNSDEDQTRDPSQYLPIHDDLDSFSEELRLVSKTPGPLHWLVGVFYFHDLSDLKLSDTGDALGGLTLEGRFKQQINSYAAFGQATYDLPAGFHLTGGLRYTKDELRKNAWQTLAPLFAVADTDRTSESAWTYKVNLAKDLAPGVSAYLGYSTGFKGGIFNSNDVFAPPVKPEKLTDLEAGLKTELFDRRLRLNLAVYHYEYKDLQVTSLTRADTGQTSSSLQNAASARNTGFEADFEAHPTGALTLRGGVEVMHSRFVEFPTATISVPLATGGNITVSGDAKGLMTPHSPDFSGNLGAEYRVATAVGQFTGAVNYSYTSSFAWDADNRLKEKPYGLVNASVAWSPDDAGWQVTVWGKNLTDVQYSIYTTANVVGDEESPAPPRTYGVTVTRHFF